MYQALYRKWRPRTFDDVVGQSHITETLKRQVAEGRLSHAYLFTGTRGTGKTSCAKILARAVNCEHPVNGSPCNECDACRGIESGAVMDVLELDAASNNGVDQVRALRDEAVYSPAAVRKRVYIIDEVHMLSNQAFNALLKILEEPPAHLIFILATTEVHKVLPTIKSRCQQFAFKRISPTDIAQRLKYVAGEEKIPLTNEGAALLARLADGGMRDALSLLDQCATGAEGSELGETEILDALGLAGNVETAALMGEIAARNTAGALNRLKGLYDAGKDVGSLLGELSSLTRDLLIRKTAPQGGSGLLTGGYDEATIRGLSEALTSARLAQMLGQLQSVCADLGRSVNRRVDAELCIIRLCDESLDGDPAGLNARLSRLEELMAKGIPAAAPVQAAPIQSVPAATPAQNVPAPAPISTPAVPQSVQAPPPIEEAPPWAQESPTVKTIPAPPAAAQAVPPVRPDPAPAAQAVEPTVSKVSPAAPSNLQGFWPDMVHALHGKVPAGEYSFLSNGKMVQGVIDGPLLKLLAQNDFVRSMINKPGIMAAVTEQAKLLPGGPYRVTVVGTLPAPQTVGHVAPTASTSPAAPIPPTQSAVETQAPEGLDVDPLDSLLAMGNEFGDIITEED